jgi:hypothetical protein
MNGKEYSFPLYKDDDIGINMFWQSHIIESLVDEDVDTDNDQLNVANLHGLVELKEGIQDLISRGWKTIRNKPCFRNN